MGRFKVAPMPRNNALIAKMSNGAQVITPPALLGPLEMPFATKSTARAKAKNPAAKSASSLPVTRVNSNRASADTNKRKTTPSSVKSATVKKVATRLPVRSTRKSAATIDNTEENESPEESALPPPPKRQKTIEPERRSTRARRTTQFLNPTSSDQQPGSPVITPRTTRSRRKTTDAIAPQKTEDEIHEEAVALLQGFNTSPADDAAHSEDVSADRTGQEAVNGPATAHVEPIGAAHEQAAIIASYNPINNEVDPYADHFDTRHIGRLQPSPTSWKHGLTFNIGFPPYANIEALPPRPPLHPLQYNDPNVKREDFVERKAFDTHSAASGDSGYVTGLVPQPAPYNGNPDQGAYLAIAPAGTSMNPNAHFQLTHSQFEDDEDDSPRRSASKDSHGQERGNRPIANTYPRKQPFKAQIMFPGYPGPSAVVPPNFTLWEICQHMPNHLREDILLAFVQQNWSANEVCACLRDDAKDILNARPGKDKTMVFQKRLERVRKDMLAKDQLKILMHPDYKQYRDDGRPTWVKRGNQKRPRQSV